MSAAGAVVPERQRCICPDVCLDHCRACNHRGRDLEEPCIADPDWMPDEDDLARRENRIVVHVVEPAPAPPAGPCPVTRGPHRWAWLTAGGQACGYCGKPR